MFVIINEKERWTLIESYVTANKNELLAKPELREKVDRYMKRGDYESEIEVLTDLVEDDYEGCDNKYIEPLIFETNGWDHFDMVGTEEWSKDDVRNFITKYLPEFSFKGREYVSDRVDVLPYEEDWDDDDLEDEEGYEPDEFAWLEEDSSPKWPIDDFSDHFGSREEEMAFWEANIK